MHYYAREALTKYLSCLLILLLGLCMGCAGKEEIVKVALDQEFSLRIGQTAQIESEQLAIRFNGIDTDSRCPRGVTCIWAGEVLCNVTATYEGSSSHITLSQSGLTAPPVENYYEVYWLDFSVEPYPEAGKQISTADYRLKMTVKKLPQGPPTK
jgi:hypothetical protein